MNATQTLPTLFTGISAEDLDVEKADFVPLTADGRSGVEIHRLYGTAQTGPDGPAAGLVRYAPGAHTQAHEHAGYELIFVLDGEMQSGGHDYPAGSLLVLPPGSVHSPASADGCTLLVVWEQPVKKLA